MPRTASSNCENLIAGFEKRVTIPYNDIAGNATNGIGHLLHEGPCTDEDLPVSEAQVDSWFQQDTQVAVNAINKYVKVDLTQNQFDGLVSWTFNLGAGTLLKSTVLVLLNQGNYRAASDHMLLYNKAKVNGVLIVSAGLDRRRKAEVALFLTPDNPQAA